MTKSQRIHLSSHMLVCGQLRESGIPESDIVWAPDLLSWGPILPPWEPLHFSTRRTFWEEFYGPLLDSSLKPDAYKSICNAIEKFACADEIIIWAGPSVEEQIFFVWSVAVLLQLGITKEQLRYLLVAEDPHYRKPLSMLNLSNEGYAKALLSGGYALNEDDFKTLNEAWLALCSPDPREISRCRKETSPQLCLIFDRIVHLQRHYPNIRTGLNDFDYRLLQLCAKCGPQAAAICFEYVINDHYEFEESRSLILHARLNQLASDKLKHPLVRLEGNSNEFRSFTAKLTDEGKAVLLGEANHVELNGIDEWIGGVHLKSPRPIWFYDPNARELVQGA